MKIEYHPLVVDDLVYAETQYNELQPGLGEIFKAEVIKTIERVRENPFL